ncbi:MAG: biopolymer transporter ExbD [Candidatus Omnitrophica bacterium]|nr:biopolymer transporter ExbD [Candidatus Omnitrophota bacterium]
MKVRSSTKSFLSLESVAMTDIVMNLFIFFFISFSLLYTFSPHKEAKIEVKLPEAASERSGKGDEPLMVSVTSGNEIFIGKARILPGELKRELAQRSRSGKFAGVVVRADKLASVDYLVKVLDAAKQAGVQKLGVAVEKGGE